VTYIHHKIYSVASKDKSITMAAPAEITIKDLSGEWVLNKTLSDDTDPVLALQGIPWLKRKAIAWATVTLHVKQYTSDADKVVHIDIDQTATGGIKGTTELRTLDWTEREHYDDMFGQLKGQSRFTGPGSEGWDALDSFLKEGWLEGEVEKVQSYVVNAKDEWTGEQIWGFSEIDGKRYYTRRVIVIKGETVLKIRMVYDWQGKKE